MTSLTKFSQSFLKNEKDVNDLFYVVNRLETAGYDILDSYEEKGEFLARKGIPECRTHYIHIELIGSTYWKEFIYFKRYLLDHPECVRDYQKLKEELSKKYADDRKNTPSQKMNLFLTF